MEIEFGHGKVAVGSGLHEGKGIMRVTRLKGMHVIGEKPPKDEAEDVMLDMSFANLNSLKVVINSLRRLEHKMKKGAAE